MIVGRRGIRQRVAEVHGLSEFGAYDLHGGGLCVSYIAYQDRLVCFCACWRRWRESVFFVALPGLSGLADGGYISCRHGSGL